MRPAAAACTAAFVMLAAVANAQEMPTAGSAGGLGEILGRPLPGTPAREDADAAQRLEAALRGFQGVGGAHVIISRSADSDTDAPVRRAAVQLSLTPEHEPSARWVDGLSAFILAAVPHLQAGELTIVDAAGRTLYSRGSPARFMTAPAPPPAASAGPFPFAGLSPWIILAAALVCAAGLAFVLLRGARVRPPEEPQRTPSEFAFLTSLPDERLRAVLGDERPELLAMVLAQVDRRDAQRMREVLELPSPIAPAAEPDPDVVSAVAEALRRKVAG
ncbi:MAG: hypothetical protein U9R79_14580 [Armatimonadota bacterium]|nr:hypothetical protein [Armatimonadota bacterium]